MRILGIILIAMLVLNVIAHALDGDWLSARVRDILDEGDGIS